MSVRMQKDETAGTADVPQLSEPFLGKHWQRLAALALWLLLIAGYVWYTTVNDLGPLVAARQLLEVIRGSAVGPLLFIVIYTLRPLIFFSSAVLTLMGGFLFGPFWGVIYSVAGGMSSAFLAFWVGYFFGEGVLDEDESEGIMQRYARRMRRNSFETVLIMRFLFLPFDPVSYLAGFLRIDWKAYMLATFLGSLPGGISIALAGASGNFDQSGLSFNPWILLPAGLLFLLSLGLSRYVRRREQKSNTG